MNFTLTDQSIQYTFKADKYDKGQMQRSLQNVKPEASAESLVKVGQAISKLQGDELTGLTLVQKHGLSLA
ncbi:hypothetical protein lacNasYZ03_12320 [Lactobacillus nasalidis]|uniref:DUF1659 domain-containing protein n=1 Tax=Lactobacillus nasalidis TaxID=2797258 RepID=A0ABQ3W854_9LACO|nr:DUF1659 domain-containing protein [Lactobacillus nasalidis]GHV96944.1 hypothetical protein lacNasYZ01_01260 [Lactobacillus nasalidis]GHW00071.1 hypothetical protein lacNasYZ02_15000 [Lactobacillus nasalidis]GHW01545.1 hypothetical protein lacNasYZ03_12320 [Lactobacillus nasalidis]